MDSYFTKASEAFVCTQNQRGLQIKLENLMHINAKDPKIIQLVFTKENMFNDWKQYSLCIKVNVKINSLFAGTIVFRHRSDIHFGYKYDSFGKSKMISIVDDCYLTDTQELYFGISYLIEIISLHFPTNWLLLLPHDKYEAQENYKKRKK